MSSDHPLTFEKLKKCFELWKGLGRCFKTHYCTQTASWWEPWALERLGLLGKVMGQGLGAGQGMEAGLGMGQGMGRVRNPEERPLGRMPQGHSSGCIGRIPHWEADVYSKGSDLITFTHEPQQIFFKNCFCHCYHKIMLSRPIRGTYLHIKKHF